MTATHASPPAATQDQNSRYPAMLVVGLVACIAGFALLVASALLPDSLSYPVVVLTTAVNQAAAAPMAVPQDVARVTEDRRLLTTFGDPAANARRAEPITTQDHRNADQIALVRPGLDFRGGSPRPSPCLKTDLERDARVESTHLATIPLRRDQREALITLVAAQHGGSGNWSGPCLMRRLSLLNPMQADSDDRIANALVGLAPSNAPRPPTQPR